MIGGIDLSGANWLAYLIEPHAALPELEDGLWQQAALSSFLDHLQTQFHSTLSRESRIREMVGKAQYLLNDWKTLGGPPEVLRELREDLGNRPWVMLILPSGREPDLDTFLCSRYLLRRLVAIRPDEPGLILQLDYAVSDDVFALENVFPAFRTALADVTQWPGALIWKPGGDSTFLPFSERTHEGIERSLEWITAQLAASQSLDLQRLSIEYRASFPNAKKGIAQLIHLVQISDLHLGSDEAVRRLPRLQQLIRNILKEYGTDSTMVPVVTGDLMDDPDQRALGSVRAFMDFLRNLGIEAPVTILGNHDVRQDGWLADDFRSAMSLPTNRIAWFDTLGVGIVCFNSVISGRLARGRIGEEQFVDLGSDIDAKPDWRRYGLVGLVHHHPTPVKFPEWYYRPIYERLNILDAFLEGTRELEDAEVFLNWVEERGLVAVLHGHKHIPRIDHTPKKRIPIFGCGSSVGKVSTRPGNTYMSINVITIDNAAGQLSARLLVERLPGAGLVEDHRHEVVYRQPIAVP